MQKRTKVAYKFEAGPSPEQPGAIPDFVLRQVTYRQCRRSDRELWRSDSSDGPTQVWDDIGVLNRDELAELIADGARWLSYIEEG